MSILTETNYRKSVKNRLTLIIVLWILDKAIMLLMMIFLTQ